MAEVPPDRAKRIVFDHCADGSQLFQSFCSICAGDESDALSNWEIGLVDALSVITVVGFEKMLEDLLLIRLVAGMGKRGMIGTGLWTVG